jgi:hypothetical protein
MRPLTELRLSSASLQGPERDRGEKDALMVHEERQDLGREGSPKYSRPTASGAKPSFDENADIFSQVQTRISRPNRGTRRESAAGRGRAAGPRYAIPEGGNSPARSAVLEAKPEELSMKVTLDGMKR